jgi:hypothetical protein
MKPINEQLPEDFSNEDSLISDYLNGHLAESEKIAFEKRLLEDSNFAKEVEFQKELALAVRMQERRRLKESLKKISVKNKAAASQRPQLSIAAIISIFIVSGVSLMIYLNSNDDFGPTKDKLSANEDPIINSKVDPTDIPVQIEKPSTGVKSSANTIEQEQLNESIASRIETKTLKVFPLKVTNDESFGFGSNSSNEIVVHIHRKTDSKSNNENQNAYMLWKNDLDIWIDTKQDIILYSLQEDYIADDDLIIKDGLYCRIGNDFYYLKDYNRIQPLVKVSKEVNRYLLNQE